MQIFHISAQKHPSLDMVLASEIIIIPQSCLFLQLKEFRISWSCLALHSVDVRLPNFS